MSTLYRKYRPQNFKEVVGQNHIKITLSHEIEAGKIAHAYLFCGPRAVGKTTLSRVFAKSVNCLERKEGTHESCGKCSNCLEISDGSSIDIIEIDAASHTGVDNVRENIINASRITPSKSKYKVFIIDEVHMLSISAFNALLKILEEPPKHVIFILCTTEIHKVPSTIVSRCQRFDFKKIGMSDVITKLSYIAQKEELDIDKKVLEMIAKKSEGHMRDAESIFGQIISISGTKKISKEDAELIVPSSTFEEAVSLVSFLSLKDVAKSIILVNKMLDDGINLKNFLDDLIEVLRKMMFIKINPSLDNKVGAELGENIDAEILKILKTIELEQIVSSIEYFSDAKLKLKNSFIIQLPIEIAIIKICNKATSQNVEVQTKKIVNNQAISSATSNTIKIDTDIIENNTNSGANINLEQINAKWSEVLMQIKKINHSLVLVVQASKPKEIVGSTLRLSTKYKFHKDRIEDISIKILLEKVLHSVFGRKIQVEAVVDENLEIQNNKTENKTSPASENIPSELSVGTNVSGPTSGGEQSGEKKDNNMMNNLLKNFGGKVVNG